MVMRENGGLVLAYWLRSGLLGWKRNPTSQSIHTRGSEERSSGILARVL